MPAIELGATARLPDVLLQTSAAPIVAARAAATPGQPPLLLLALALGAAALALIALRQQALVRRWRRLARPTRDRAHALDAGAATIRIVPASRIAATSGLLRPAIWIGARLLDDPRLPFVITHEQVHVQQHDYRWVWLITGVRCLCWWHPCVWLWSWIARREMEFSCDERCAARFGTASYRTALAGLMRHRLSPAPLLPFIGRPSFDILRLTRLEKTPVTTTRHRLAVLLTALLLPLLSLKLVVADDGVSGGTAIVEGEDGVEVRADDVPVTVLLTTVGRRMGFRTLHLHPSARGGMARLAVAGTDWSAVLPEILDGLKLAYRVEGDRLIVAPADQLADRSWVGPGSVLTEPAGQQIGAAIEVFLDGRAAASRRDLLLTEGNWAGVLGAGLRLNVRPVLLGGERVQLEFSIVHEEAADGSAISPVLITEYGRTAALQMGSTGEDGSPPSLRIEVTPRRL